MAADAEPRELERNRPRVVSLVPSVTESLVAWGITPVGCTRFCEQPDLEPVGGTKDPDITRVLALAPDLVVVDEEENRREDAEKLVDAGLAVHVTAVRAVADVAPTLRRLREAVGLGGDFEYGPLPAPREVGVRAFVPIWRNPYMTLNRFTYGSSVLERLGVDNVFGASSERYPELILAEAAARDPDVVLAPSEPFPFSERPEQELSAVAPVVFVDGQDLFWWGVRTPAALARLAAQITSSR